MPTPRSTGPALRAADLSLNEYFSFASGTWKPGNERVFCDTPCRWSTWAEYFAAWELVREEYLAAPRHQGMFAEFARPYFLAGKDLTQARDTYARRRDQERRR